VPLQGGPAAIRRLLELSAEEGRSSFLAVLKRFGAASGLLSFPIPGWTLALDFPVKPGLLPFLDRLDQVVMEVGGRVYLAKDARLPAAHLAVMYPELERWRAIKASVDPANRFTSVLARRVGLVEPQSTMQPNQAQAA
jgi:decaprenylphospho-beta-D-ribofuranose 2-oxidase